MRYLLSPAHSAPFVAVSASPSSWCSEHPDVPAVYVEEDPGPLNVPYACTAFCDACIDYIVATLVVLP